MYLRTIQRRNSDGSVVKYHQLAENVWDPARKLAVAKVVYSFGRADEIDRTALRRLAASILRVCPSDAGIAADPDVRVIDSWPYGGIYALESLWCELEIPRVIQERCRRVDSSQPFERALFAMVANRALRPYSKLHCYEQWLKEEVFLPTSQPLELQHLYRAMDFLGEHKDEIERAIFFRTADLFNADVDLIFYDTTSLHFEVDDEDDGEAPADGGPANGRWIRRRGYSKNGRGDAPQIVVGLAVTRDGLPVRSWVFPGNTSDVTTVENVKADLRGWRLNRCVFVGDAGMNSAENRRTLALGGGKYILASKLRAGDEVSSEVLTRAGRYQIVAENLRVKEVVVGDGERRQRYVVCCNPQEAERQSAHRERILEELRAELESIKQPVRGGRHAKRTCRLVTTERFRRYIRQTSGGTPEIDPEAVAAEAKLDGKWVVTSNDDSLTAEDLALGYKQLLRVEQCWRTMKTGLRMRPVYHWRSDRIAAHVSLCVLALLLERVAEMRGGDTWRNLLARLDTIKVVEYERGPARVRQTTQLRPEAADVLRHLRIAPPKTLHAVETTTSA